MVSLLDLPLECFRLIVECIAESFGIPELLQLRLVHNVFDSEVLRSSAVVELFQPYGRISKLCLTQKPVPSGYIDFVAAFICVNPRCQGPWNANLSSVVSHVADSILLEDGLDLYHLSRAKLVRDLCRHTGEIHHWRERPYWSQEDMFPTEEFAEKCGTLEFNVLLAKILLGRCTHLPKLPKEELVSSNSIVFGTVIQACVKSGQLALAANLDLDCYSSFLALDTAVECDNLDMLHFLHSTKCRSASGSALEQDALTAASNDRTQAALYLLRNWQGETEQLHRTARGIFHTACQRGNLDLLIAVVDDLRLVDLEKVIRRSPELPTAMVAIFYRHRYVFRFLFNRALLSERDHEYCLHSLASCGDVSMAICVMGECGIRLTEKTWCAFLGKAIALGTARHIRLVETLINEPHLFDVKEAKLSDRLLMKSGLLEPEKLFKEAIRRGRHGKLFFDAIVHGNLLVVKKLAEYGADLDILDRPDHEVTSSVLVALSAGQTVIAEALIRLGAKTVNPMESHLKGKFETGELPKVYPKRPMHILECYRCQW